MILLLSLAILGLFGGDGYFNNVKIARNDLEIHYQKFLRAKLESGITLKLKKPVKKMTVAMDARYCELINVEKVLPEPASQTVTDYKTVFEFNNLEEGLIMLDVLPQKAGIYNGNLIINGEKFPVYHIIYF